MTRVCSMDELDPPDACALIVNTIHSVVIPFMDHPDGRDVVVVPVP